MYWTIIFYKLTQHFLLVRLHQHRQLIISSSQCTTTCTVYRVENLHWNASCNCTRTWDFMNRASTERQDILALCRGRICLIRNPIIAACRMICRGYTYLAVHYKPLNFGDDNHTASEIMCSNSHENLVYPPASGGSAPRSPTLFLKHPF